MTTDKQSLDRTAQRLIVETRRGRGSPPNYDPIWDPLWAAKVDRITINHGARPSIATIWFPKLRWQNTYDLLWADMIRIRSDQPDSIVVFEGFVTSYLTDFSGGTRQPGSAYERNAISCSDYRWLLSATSPVFGQVARGPDDYANYGTDEQSPKSGSYTKLTGRRTIFNADGDPNKDTVPLTGIAGIGSIPIFVNSDSAAPWTARDMICYLLSPFYNTAYRYIPIADPSAIVGLYHADWNTVLNHIVVDGLNVIESIHLICSHLGWSFRESYSFYNTPTLVFYKLGTSAVRSRSSSPTVLHQLHAPAVGENIQTAVSQGRKILWSMSMAEDISAMVNRPVGLAAPDRFEFTAELVPAWDDSDLQPDDSDDYSNLFLTESELQATANPNSYTYYKYYHPSGSGFLRDVGRKWALNESGRYSGNATYDRGMPFDFSTVIDAQYILDSHGNRRFAPFNRRLLPCLTVDDTNNSVGVKVEFSFDGGLSWQVIPAAISALPDECGIYIDEANLAEIADEANRTIIDKDEEGEGVNLDGFELNLWTSLCDDKINSRSFKDRDQDEDNIWRTRIRVTASVQMDRRLIQRTDPPSASASPFHHSQLYDLSKNYGLAKRTTSSIFTDSGLSANEVDNTDWFDTHLDAIRRANKDMSISGQFTLDRLWLNDFLPGDQIERITGRNYDLAADFGDVRAYPEIIQIIYLPDKQKTKLITRDLRFAEVPL